MRGSSIVKQLLAFSRQQVSQPKAVDVNGSLEDVLKMLQRVVREDIQISLELDRTPCRVLIDSGQFLQVVMNLVVNAQDAMPTGGTIRIKTRHVVPCPEGGTGSRVEISVQDNGCGIAPEHRDHIFEPFFTTKEVGKGTGLGLATTYGIVKQAHGQIDFESEIGRGTTFRVLLPETGVQPEAQSQAARHHPPSVAAKMLLVEDNAAVRISLYDALSSSGIDVYAFDGPLSAAKFVEQNSFDVLVTDLVMPGGRGDEFAQRLRERNPELPVIFISGYPDQIMGAEQLPSKTILLQKPFCIGKLLEQVLALTKDSATYSERDQNRQLPAITTVGRAEH